MPDRPTIRPRPRRFAAVALLTLFVATIQLATSEAHAAQTLTRTLDCTRLAGDGTFSNPLRLGKLTGTTTIVGCPGLSSGWGFVSRYFLFTVQRRARPGAWVGTRFVLRQNAISAVHPRLATTDGWVLMTSMSHGQWARQGQALIRYLPLEGAYGRYVFGVEKLDSPLRSTRTPRFDIIFVLP